MNANDTSHAPGTAPVTLITGGSSGIGLATARLLKQKGHRLALVARRPEPLAEARAELGDDVLIIEADMGDPAWEGAIVHGVVDHFHRLDAIVHAAGYAPLASLDETAHLLLRDVFMVNTLGPIELTRRARDVFEAQQNTTGHALPGGACVVMISSYASADPFPGFLAYAGAKAAINVMTKVLAQELGEIGVRAYSVAPAAVETPMLRGLFTTDQIPEEACLDPEDVAKLVADCMENAAPCASGCTAFIKQTPEGVRITAEPV